MCAVVLLLDKAAFIKCINHKNDCFVNVYLINCIISLLQCQNDTTMQKSFKWVLNTLVHYEQVAFKLNEYRNMDYLNVFSGSHQSSPTDSFVSIQNLHIIETCSYNKNILQTVNQWHAREKLLNITFPLTFTLDFGHLKTVILSRSIK